jgi:hypothetical protein
VTQVFDVDELITVGKERPNGLAFREGEISSNGSMSLKGESIAFNGNLSIEGSLENVTNISATGTITGQSGNFEGINATGTITGQSGNFEGINATGTITGQSGNFEGINVTNNVKGKIAEFEDVLLSSSQELKQDISSLSFEEASKLLTDIEPVRYTFKNDSLERIGFIAENVPSIFANDDRTKIRYLEIVSVLTRIVKDQQRRIERLEGSLKS